MYFDLVQSISLAGDPTTANDDRAGASAALAWVIDGATDLGPPGLVGEQGGAAWLAATADAAFATTAPPLDEACEHVFAALAERFTAARRRDPAGAWELPSGALIAVAIEGEALAYGWTGDCAALLALADGVRWLGDPPDRLAESAAAAALGQSVSMKTAAVIEDRRAARAHPRRQVLGVSAAASATAMTYGRAKVGPGDELLLTSDGFSALIDAYGAHTPESLVAAVRERGLAALAIELRAIEAATPDHAFHASSGATTRPPCGSASPARVNPSITILADSLPRTSWGWSDEVEGPRLRVGDAARPGTAGCRGAVARLFRHADLAQHP